MDYSTQSISLANKEAGFNCSADAAWAGDVLVSNKPSSPPTVDLSTLSDEELMARVIVGDDQAYALLVDRHAKRYRALAFQFLADGAAAEDCVQDAFIALWQRPSRFDAEKARFTTWFHRVVVNRALDMKRKRMPERLPEGFDAPDGRKSAEEVMATKDTWRSVIAGIEALPERQATAIRLTYLDGLPNADAATVMALKVKAFESLLLRARAGLKAKLGLAGPAKGR